VSYKQLDIWKGIKLNIIPLYRNNQRKKENPSH